MKLKRFIITGVILAGLGLGLTAVASTQLDFREEFKNIYVNPSLEEHKKSFGTVSKVIYEGTDESLDIIYHEGENSFTYHESKNLSYDIIYDEDLQELKIKQNHSWSFLKFGFINKKAVLMINSSLEKLELSVSAGNVHIKGMDLTTGNFHLSAGNLVIEDASIDDVTIDASAGNIRMERSWITKADLNLSAGNLKIQETIFNTIKAKLTAGNLNLNGDILAHGSFDLITGNLNISLPRAANCYQVNGRGDGDSIILYDVNAGNKTINFQD